MEEIVALLIPILFVIGLFTAISLNVYFKYKTRTVTAEHASGESIGEWYKAEVQAKAVAGRGAALRVGGLLTGAGVGVAIGCVVRILMLVDYPGDTVNWKIEPYAVFLIIALAIFCGGLGMVGAYFLERRLDGKSKGGTPAAN